MDRMKKKEDEEIPWDEYPIRIKLMKLFWMLGPAFVRWAESQMEKDGYTPQRMYLLGTLYEYGPMMMSGLKDRLGVTATNITAHVDALEREGMVERVPLPSDRRVTIISLTPQAEESLQKLCSPFMNRVASIFDTFTPEEQSTFLSCLLRMRAVLVENRILDEKSRSFGRQEVPKDLSLSEKNGTASSPNPGRGPVPESENQSSSGGLSR